MFSFKKQDRNGPISSRIVAPWNLSCQGHVQAPGALAGGRPFYTTDTWVSFSGCRTLAVGEGAGLGAALLRSWDGDVDAIPGENCLRSRPHVIKCECRWPCRCSSWLRIACASVAHPRLPSAGSRECGARKFKSKGKPKNHSTSMSTTAVVASPVTMRQIIRTEKGKLMPRERVRQPLQKSSVNTTRLQRINRL